MSEPLGRRLFSLAPRYWAALFFASCAILLMSSTWRAENAESLAKVNDELAANKRIAVARANVSDEHRAWVAARDPRVVKLSSQELRALRQSPKPADKKLVAAAMLDLQQSRALLQKAEELNKAIKRLLELEPRRIELEKQDTYRGLVQTAALTSSAGTAVLWCFLFAAGWQPLPTVPDSCRTVLARRWYWGWRSAWAVFWAGLPLWLGAHAAVFYEPPSDVFVCNHDLDLSLPTSRPFIYFCAAAALLAAAFIPSRTARLFPPPGGAYLVGWPWRFIHRLIQRRRRRTATERELFELSGFLNSALCQGLPLNEAFRSYAAGITAPWRRELFIKLAGRLEAGAPLSTALEAQPEFFPPAFAALMRAGEAQDDLPRALLLASETLSRGLELSESGMAALVYCVLVTAAGLFVTLFTLIFIIPAFEAIYSVFGAELPWMTQALIKLSHVLRLPLAAAAVAAALGWLYLWRAGVPLSGFLFSRLPPFSLIGAKIRETQFCRTLARLLQGGCEMDRALELTKAVDSDRGFQNAVERALAEVRSGGRLSKALGASGPFSGSLAWACALGEERGNLPETLLWLGDYNELSVRSRLERLAPLIERSTNIAMGVLVGLFVVAAMSPIFSIAGLASQ